MYQTFLNLLFPKRCIGCRKHGSALCATCIETLPFASSFEQSSDTYAVFDYGSHVVKKAVSNLKYYRKGAAMEALACAGAPHISEFIGAALQTISPQTIIFIPIPQYRKRAHERGYNQSALIASWLAREISGSIVRDVLSKHTATAPQAHLSRDRRLKNLVHTMDATAPINSQALYILVDDVTTTGATFTEAKRALRASGARKVLAIAIAHGYANK